MEKQPKDADIPVVTTTLSPGEITPAPSPVSRPDRLVQEKRKREDGATGRALDKWIRGKENGDKESALREGVVGPGES